ncbi:MAG: GNAT family N-acetyltransferase [Parvularculaceae bacterium]|nr:GNAT family N-acetyltransferase [Parvularculaceae bacterium]
MTEIIVRRADVRDLETLKRFEQGIVEAERPLDPTIKKGRVTYYDLGALIKSPEAFFAIAEADGEPVACGFSRRAAGRLFTEPAFYAYVGLMYVDPEWRGRGVSARILDRLKEWAREAGLTELRLEVYPANSPARRAYEKTGFEPYMLEMRLPFE